MNMAGAVEKNVRRSGTHHSGVDLVLFQDIESESLDPGMFAGKGRKRSGIDVGRPDFGAFPCHSDGGRPSDALPRRRDDSAFAVQPSGHGLLSLILFKMVADD
jgi:hypothetical protein